MNKVEHALKVVQEFLSLLPKDRAMSPVETALISEVICNAIIKPVQ